MKTNIFVIFEGYKKFIDENYKKTENKDNFIAIAELSGNILYAILLELNATNSVSYKNIKKHVNITSIIDISFSKNIDEKTKKALLYYVNNIVPNIEHIMIESFICEFLIYFAKKESP